MKKYCDLHSHSVFSDGTWTPEELIAEGERLGLYALALSDHNTIEGLPRFLKAAEGKSIKALGTCEFSTDFKETELHIVGLMIRPEMFSAVREQLNDFLRRKDESNRLLCENLLKAGYEVDYEAIKKASPGGYVNRAHIAYELKEQGRFNSVQEAFDKLLHPRFGYFIPAGMPDAVDTVRFIRKIGAIPILAHAFRSIDESGLRDFLSAAVPSGLIAMETMVSTYDEETQHRSERIADEFGLLYSGGTDFHGDKKPDIKLGVGRGNLRIPREYLLRMVERAGISQNL